jgi:hypothetical protein
VQDGERMRFCQRCGGFHLLEDFDRDNHSCRISLMRHNYRRRKKAKNDNGTFGEADGGPEVTPLPNVSVVGAQGIMFWACINGAQDISGKC